EIARAEKINPSYVSRMLRLTRLAPAIVEAAVDGRLAPDATLAVLAKPFAPLCRDQKFADRSPHEALSRHAERPLSLAWQGGCFPAPQSLISSRREGSLHPAGGRRSSRLPEIRPAVCSRRGRRSIGSPGLVARRVDHAGRGCGCALMNEGWDLPSSPP